MTVTRHTLHPEGPTLSRLVWGAWRALDGEATRTPRGLAGVIEACLDLGITSFDHADIYGGYGVESLFGEALQAWRGERERIEIVTKCGIALVKPARPDHRVKHYDTSGEHIRRSVDASLKALRTDYVDLLLLHRPDPLMDAEETARALEALVAAGKVRHLGVSNHTPAQADLLQARLGLPLVTNQIEASVLHTAPLADGTFDHAQARRMSPMIWSPLGGGRLFTGEDPQALRLRASLEAAAARLGADGIGPVALAWLLRHPSGPVPVVGSSQPARLKALAAAERLDMDRQTWFEILEASTGRPVP